MSPRQYRNSGLSRNKSNNIPFNINSDQQGGESVLTLNFQIPSKTGSHGNNSQHRMGTNTPSLLRQRSTPLPQAYASEEVYNNDPAGIESELDPDDEPAFDYIDHTRQPSNIDPNRQPSKYTETPSHNHSSHSFNGRPPKAMTSRATAMSKRGLGNSRQFSNIDDGNGRMAASRMRTTGSNVKSPDDGYAAEMERRASRPNESADHYVNDFDASHRNSRDQYEAEMDESEPLLEPLARAPGCVTCVGEDENYVCKPRYSKSKTEQEKKPLRFSECYENKFKELDSVRCEYEKQLWCLQKQLDKERRCTMEEFNSMQQEYCQYDKALEMYALRVAMDQIAISKANLEHEYADKIHTDDGGRGGDMEHPCCTSICPPSKPAVYPTKPTPPCPEPPCPLPPIPMYPPPLPSCPPRHAQPECCPEPCSDDAALKITHRQLTTACVVCAVILLFLTVRFSSLVRVLILGSGHEESES